MHSVTLKLFWTRYPRVSLPGRAHGVSLTGGAGEMKPEGMITKLIKMDEVAEQGFKALIEDKDNQVKILVDVGAKL